MINLVIFDMAGTSIDEQNLVYKTIQNVLERNEIDISLAKVLEVGAGKEKRRAIRDLLDELGYVDTTEEFIDVLHEEFKFDLDKAYETAPMEVFPSVRKVIKTLKGHGIKIAFNTGYSRAVANKILARVDIEIDALCTASDVEGNRPEPDMITYLCNLLDVPELQTIKIGDSAIDIEEGINAGVMYSIGITTGAQNAEQLKQADPDFILNDMLELLPIIYRMNKIS